MEIKIGDRFKNIGGNRTLGCIVEITEVRNSFYHYKVVKTSENCKEKLPCTICEKIQFKDDFIPVKSSVRKL